MNNLSNDINTSSSCYLLSAKNKFSMILTSGIFLFVSMVSVATAQTDAASQQSEVEGWELEAANSPKTDLKSDIDNATEASVSEVSADTELKVVNPDTELKAFDAPATAAAKSNNQLIVIENAANRAAPVLNVEPQLRADLDAQYNRVQKTLQTADAFSESLGEDYLSYGLLLKQAGRYDEAREVLVDAAHISKINNGLNAPEQRPYLAALFDIHMLQDNTEEADNALQRIIWLEQENPKVLDDLTYPLALRLGNRYMDQFLYRPVAGKESLISLSQADLYFNYVLRRYGNNPINEVKLPYGELALVNFWRSRVASSSSAPANFSVFAGRDNALGQFPNRGGRQFNNVVAPSGGVFFARAEFYLKRYLARARNEGSPQTVIKAILNLGDINLMQERRQIASDYYRLAWIEGLKLAPGDPFLETFDRPVALPDFEYALERKHVVKGDQALLIPMKFKVDQFGRVGDVQPIEEANRNFPYFTAARRAVRKITYRPIIREGKLVATGVVSDDVLVQIKGIIESPDVIAPDTSNKEVPVETSANEIDDAASTVQEPNT